MIKLDFENYLDRIYGAWLGKSIGGAVGAAFENHKEFKPLDPKQIWPEKLPPNDDLDIQVVWLEALQERGCYLTQQDLVELWQDRCWYNFCEYGVFLRNVQRGIMPPLSGVWNNDFFVESEGCPIRSDIWGLVCPGNPKLAAHFARMDGELDHGGFAVEVEMFLSAMTASALIESDFETIVATALKVLPSSLQIKEVIDYTEEIAGQSSDYRGAWRQIIRKYGNRDASKAISNFALALLALYRSKGDFTKAMTYCCESGWDADCTAATIGGFLGAWHGTKCIPAKWRKKLGKKLICNVDVKHKNSLIFDFARDTALVGLEMALVRNDCISFTGAPGIIPRQAVAAKPEIKVEYPDDPVLYAEKPSRVILRVLNYDGIARITPASGTVCEPESVQGCSELVIRRIDQDEPLPDKNLFTVEAGSGKHIFGLGGAASYWIYGPYWDMHDREKNGDKCPYSNHERNCHPIEEDCESDSFHTYVDINREYLDEKRFVTGEIPEEQPESLECGTDFIHGSDIGGWFGPACWYFSRNIIIPDGKKVLLNLSINGLMKVWINGKEKFASDLKRDSWNGTSDCSIKITGNGKIIRLAVKAVSFCDVPDFYCGILRDEPLQQKAGVSYQSDFFLNVRTKLNQ